VCDEYDELQVIVCVCISELCKLIQREHLLGGHVELVSVDTRRITLGLIGDREPLYQTPADLQ
jgi:hypothetical protein